MRRPTRLQWCIIWLTVLVGGHVWLELNLVAWLPAVRPAVRGKPAQAERTLYEGTQDLGKGWTSAPVAPVIGRMRITNPASEAVPSRQRRVLWRESSWGVGAYLAPVAVHEQRATLVVVLIGLLLVWQVSGKKATK